MIKVSVVWHQQQQKSNDTCGIKVQGYQHVPFFVRRGLIILATQTHQVLYLEDPKNGSKLKVVQVVQNKHIWDVSEVDDIKNEQLNVIEIVVDHRVDQHIEDDTLYKTDIDPTIVEKSVVHHVAEKPMEKKNCHIKAN